MARKIPCLKGYPTAQDALRRLKQHGCVYKCVQEACQLWHTNHKKLPMWNESARDHIARYARNHEMKVPQKPHCHKCHKDLNNGSS